MTEEETKTIHEWSEHEGITVLDSDGFDRNDPDLTKKKFTYNESQQGIISSTLEGVIKKGYHND